MKKLPVTRYPLPFLLFSFLLFTLLPTFAFAQQPHQHPKNRPLPTPQVGENPKVFFEVRFGPTIDWFSPTSYVIKRESVKAGFLAGVGVDVAVVEKRFLYVTTGVMFKYLQGEITFANQYSLLDTVFTTPNAKRTYQTMYLTIPTGIMFRTPPSKNCVFMGKVGLYHSFKVSGTQFDKFELPEKDANYYITKSTEPNKDAALFAEAGYAGVGFEYILGNRTRVFTHIDYNCQFNYFGHDARKDLQFKSIVHSLHIMFGFLF